MKQGEASKSFAFFTVGVEGSNFDVLAQIATRAPVKLKGLNFRDLFLWLSQSMQSVSQSSPATRSRSRRPAGPTSERKTPCGSWSTAPCGGRPTSTQGSLARILAPEASSARRLFAACADGAGSAELSHLGSKAAVERFMEEAASLESAPTREQIEIWVDAARAASLKKRRPTIRRLASLPARFSPRSSARTGQRSLRSATGSIVFDGPDGLRTRLLARQRRVREHHPVPDRGRLPRNICGSRSSSAT